MSRFNNEKEFLRELEQFAEQQRQLIEAEVSGFSTNAKDQAERIEKSKDDFEYFCRTYFPHYIKKSKSVFHQYMYENIDLWMNDSKSVNSVTAAPRGEGKSTLFTQLLPIWCVLTERKKFIVIVMDSLEQATMMLEAIKVELSFNARLSQDYPKAAGQGPTWQVAKAVTKQNVMLVAAGSGKKLRGMRHGPYRPDLVVLDDIENDENVQNKKQRDKLQKWIDKAILKLKERGEKMDVVYIGTVLHYDSVLNRTLKNPLWRPKRFKAIIKWPDRMDLWDKFEEILINSKDQVKADRFYKENKEAMDYGAVVSWPDAEPIVELMKERALSHSAFDSEMQNDPTDSENAPFKDIQFWVHDSDWVFYGAVDPSLGKRNKSNDPSAILVGGWDKANGRLDVVVGDVARRLPNLIIQRVIDLQKEFRCVLWAVESVQFQEFLRTQLISEGIKQGVPVPAMGVIPSTDKDLRIQSLQPFVEHGNIRLHKSQTVLVEQMQHYPEADHDDGPDALEMLWSIATSGAAGIPQILSAGRQEMVIR